MSTLITSQDSNNTFLTRDEIAARWKCSKETVKRRERAGMLKRISISGRLYRYRLADVLKLEGTS